jgi:serine/threonine-protein kinase
MLTRNGEVKVMDFGIARAVSDAQATMTQTAQVIGTAQYLSPEQARGERVDARSDLYSTGCLLYELLTGRPPFLGDSPVAIAYQHVRENPVPPSHLDPEIPEWADSIVLRAMAKDPARRYQSAADMRTDIQRALSGVPVAAPRGAGYATTQRMGGTAMAAGPTGAIPGYEYGPEEDDYTEGGGSRRRTWLLWAAGALLVLAVLGGVAYAFFGGSGGVAVPQVSGLPVKQAEAQVTKAGLVPKVVKETSSSVQKGFVISTDPANGNLVPKGTTVTLKVSNGAPKVPVPDVVHQPEPNARNLLVSRGFQVKEETDPNSTAKPDTVVRQDPPAGTLVSHGASVTIFVSPGGSQIPDVVNEQIQLAQGQLANAGFTNIQINEVSSPGLQDGIVTMQDPPAGQTVPTSTLITLNVVKNQPTQPPTTAPPTTTPPTSSSPSP